MEKLYLNDILEVDNINLEVYGVCKHLANLREYSSIPSTGHSGLSHCCLQGEIKLFK